MIRAAYAASFALASLASIGQSQQQGRGDAAFTWSKQLPAGSLLRIQNGDGPIAVREASGDRVELRAVKVGRGSPRDVAFEVRETEDGVTICTLYDDQPSCRNRQSWSGPHMRVEYTVSIPRSLRLRVSTGNGAVSIERAGAEVAASTGNGRITIGATSGRVDASTGNGDIDVQEASGPVRVSTGNGHVFVLTARGEVTASSGSGDVDVRIKSLASDADMSFSTGNGSIHLGLPSNFNGRIDATSGSGSLRSDFDLTVLGTLNPRHVRGTIGSGGRLIRLSTGSGEIELRKT